MNCPKCGRYMVKTRYGKEQWDTMTEAEKDAVKADPLSHRPAGEEQQEQQELLENIKAIRHDLHFLYVLVLVSLILGVVTGVIALVSLL